MSFNTSTRQMLANMGVGLRVDRPAAALAATSTTFFTVTGVVQVTGLYGIVTVASGANNCSWRVVPTAGTNVTLCANLDIDPALVGDLLGITGVLATAMTYGGAVVGVMQPLVVTAGSIQFTAAAADGSISAHCYYLPMSAGASVVAA
jgi:hypothetical protein